MGNSPKTQGFQLVLSGLFFENRFFETNESIIVNKSCFYNLMVSSCCNQGNHISFI